MLRHLRQNVMLFALGIIVIFAGIDPTQAAPDLAMAAMDGPCCADDCLPTPDCAPVCAAMMKCNAGTAGPPGSLHVVIEPAVVSGGWLAGADVTALHGSAAEVLRRPPKL